jgi:hypothetical protein
VRSIDSVCNTRVGTVGGSGQIHPFANHTPPSANAVPIANQIYFFILSPSAINHRFFIILFDRKRNMI